MDHLTRLRQAKAALAIAIWVLLLACDAERSATLHGTLIASNAGGAIRELNLASGKVVRQQHSGSGPGNITRIDPNRFAIDRCDSAGKCSISIVHRSGETQLSIANAVNPLFVPERQTLVHFRGAGDEGWSLVSAPLDSLESFTVVLSGIRNPPRSRPIVSVGESVIATVDDSYRLVTIDVDSRIMNTHELVDIAPRAWMPDASTLIGYHRRDHELVLIDLQSYSSSLLGVENPDWGVVYLPDVDAILFSRSRVKWMVLESADLFLFSLHSRSESLLREGFGMSSGFWLE